MYKFPLKKSEHCGSYTKNFLEKIVHTSYFAYPILQPLIFKCDNFECQQASEGYISLQTISLSKCLKASFCLPTLVLFSSKTQGYLFFFSVFFSPTFLLLC